jgi:formate hydrogenlyase subunit 3/multisubunit Na+/H+ antiporter MnhD subunit
MFSFLNPQAPSPSLGQIAHSFKWLGWLGIWLQALLGFIPILVVLMNVFFGSGQRYQLGLSFNLWLAIIALLVLLFSIYWCYRYTRIGSTLTDPQRRPSKNEVYRVLKTGLVTNLAILVLGVLIALLRVSALTFKMLAVPQGATVLAPSPMNPMTPGAATLTPGALITPSNMIAIQSMIHGIAAGLVGLIIALILIFLVGLYRSTNNF